MDSSPEEETYEIPDISFTDTCAYPRTVVVVHLNTGAAEGAVEGTRRPKDAAGLAKAQNFSFILLQLAFTFF